ncbi:MAG: prepilin-type N-terminal cleavage/methylation domain-containing protein [Kiritimatiellae bacterium]|nr:prepilin-type N-terminal cleavage/methylation domain-containing protein [Kiritimatiellia bacterium]
MKRGGFTLVEVLVASLLLSMLVVILTMVFNQSSIAWRTGKASVAQLDKTRRHLSQIQRQADDVLPGVQPGGVALGRVVSAWKQHDWNGSPGSLRKRAVEQLGSTELTVGEINPVANDKGWSRPTINFNYFGLGSLNPYTVGVWSYGPDGKPDTEDDISSWPDDME